MTYPNNKGVPLKKIDSIANKLKFLKKNIYAKTGYISYRMEIAGEMIRQNSKLFVVVDIPSRISYNSITSMIKVIRMINSENFDISFRSIVILLFTVLLSSCLKETAVPIESAFSIESSEDKTSPVTIQLKNESYGADEYEWTFERVSVGK